MPDSVRDEVRILVARQTDGLDVRDDEDLFDGGYVNSLFVVVLATWVERRFDVSLALEELVLDDVRTIDAITAIIEQQMAGGQSWTSA